MIDSLTTKILAHLSKLQLAAQLLSLIEQDLAQGEFTNDDYDKAAEAAISLAERCEWGEISNLLKSAYNRQQDLRGCYRWIEDNRPPLGQLVLVRRGAVPSVERFSCHDDALNIQAWTRIPE